VYGKDGTPLLSWRVLVLPYLEQKELYHQFHLDEAWDSPHNRMLLERMPEIYAPPGTKARRVPPHHTVLHVFVGPGTAFDDPKGRRLEDFSDGTANTLLVVEAGQPVPWTKPEELIYRPDAPLPFPDWLFHDGFRFLMADGLVRFLKKEANEATLRALITRNGADPLVLSSDICR
jgi:hypothetical protein